MVIDKWIGGLWVSAEWHELEVALIASVGVSSRGTDPVPVHCGAHCTWLTTHGAGFWFGLLTLSLLPQPALPGWPLTPPSPFQKELTGPVPHLSFRAAQFASPHMTGGAPGLPHLRATAPTSYSVLLHTAVHL